MRRILLFVAAGLAMCTAPALAADFEVNESFLPDHLTCLEMAREEARFIVEISLLHPAVKHNHHGKTAAQLHELQAGKQDVHRERRLAECI